MTAQNEKREIGNLVVEGIPEIPKEINHTLQQYQNTREASLVGWINQGEHLVVSTRFGESTQFHLVESPGARREQITFFSEPLFNGRICPDDSRHQLTFLKDRGGNELYQIYLYNLYNKQYRRLTDGQSRNGASIWNHAGDTIVYTSTRRNGIDHDIYLCYPNAQQEDQLVYQGEGLWYPVHWSHDDEWITLNNYHSVNEAYVYRLHVQSGELIQLTPNGVDVASLNGIWAKNSSGIYFTSDYQDEYKQLLYYNIDEENWTILSKDIQWDIENLSLSPDGNFLAFTANENGISRLYLLNTVTHQYQSIENLPAGLYTHLKWHPDSQQLGMTINLSTAPADVYVLDINTQQLIRWTFSEVGGLDAHTFIDPQLIHFPTFDQVEQKERNIPAFYYLPKPVAKSKKKYPVLIYIHGGPESQFRPGFSPLFQYYLNELDIAVIAPNVRGSTGYGKNFLKLDNGYKREDSVKDIGKLIDWITQQPELDASRVAVMGGSYGGYMVLASMAHFNDRLRCGIDIVGISNFVTFLKNTKPYRRNLRRVEYGDERDPKMRQHLERISPTTNAHKITKPMLIVQGLNDPRVPASEAEQMLNAIRQNGGEAWYLLAKDEGHGFRKKTNRDFYTKAVILFLKKYLLKDPQNHPHPKAEMISEQVSK